MKKNLLLIISAFILGFLAHAFFFPDFLANGLTSVPALVLPKTNQTETAAQNDPLKTKITFDGKHFSRKNVTIGFTRYIQIVNDSKDSLMELISSEPMLNTPRGYAYTEAVEMQFNKKGQFIVSDKHNTQERMVITVK